jgi:hypothetical protein
MSRLRRLLSILAFASVLSGCQQEQAASAAPAAAIPAISSALAEESATSEESGQGSGYSFHIRYPQLQSEWSPLEQALHAYAGAQRKDFLAARTADDNANEPAYSLDLEFNIARRTADFVSVLANGSAYTGGAHPAPLVASFNLCTNSGKVIGLADLFADSDAALRALSAESRRQLEGRYEAKLRDTLPEKDFAKAAAEMREWVARGTAPTADNFDVFLVDGLESKAIGLTLVFPPYQVAAYVEGAQQVEVPAKVFYALLKPAYRDAFAIDTEADRLAPGVR